MKKSIYALALALSVGTALAHADATIYGSFRMNLEDRTGESLDLSDSGSRIGVKGDVDLGLDHTVGIFLLEQNVSMDDGALTTGRYSYVGARGTWGTAVAGRIDHPSWTYVGSVTDVFASGQGKIQSVGYVGSTTDRADRRTNSTLAYTSPTIEGFTASAGAVFNGDAGTERDRTVDGYNVGAQYNIEALTVGAAFGAVKNTDNGAGFETDARIWGLSAQYQVLPELRVAAAYEQAKDDAINTTDKGYSLAGIYEHSTGLGAALAYSTSRETNLDRERATQAEVYQRLGRGVVAAGYIDRNNANGTRGTDVAYLSYRLDF